MSLPDKLKKALDRDGALDIGGVVEGAEAFVLADVARHRAKKRPLVFVMRDGSRMPEIEEALKFVAPELPVLTLPAWDCLPYDRVGPSSEAAARRLAAMAALASLREAPHRAVILTTANALLQKMPPAELLAEEAISVGAGGQLPMEKIVTALNRGGFERVSTVRERGEYAVRGGILDVFAPGAEEPVRLDLSDDGVEGGLEGNILYEILEGPT